MRVRRDGDALEILDTWTHPVGSGEDPLQALLAALRRNRLRDHAFHIVLPARSGVCRSFRIAPEDARLRPNDLERELHDFTPFEQREVLLRWRKLGEDDSLDYRVVADRRQEILRWEAALEDAGYRYFGLGLGPAGLLHSVERLGLSPEGGRGFLLELGGRWSALTAVKGTDTVRYPLPFGAHDIDERLHTAAGDPARWMDGDSAPADPAGVVGVLGEDVGRLLSFHESLDPRSGNETIRLSGADAHRTGLRAALSSVLPLPLASAPSELPAPLRAGGRLTAVRLAERLPSLHRSLGAALVGAGLVADDLEFRPFPENVPAPPSGDLFPVAAGILAVSMAIAAFIATDTRDAYAAALEARRDVPTESPVDRASIDAIESLVDGAATRLSLARSIRTSWDLFPEPGRSGPILESLRTERDGAGYTTVLRLVLPEEGEPEPGTDEDRARRRLAVALADGWTLASARGNEVVLRRYEADGGDR
ncbi:MAG: hypothetical protein ACYTDX_08035 [Planctomycetota bacterium]